MNAEAVMFANRAAINGGLLSGGPPDAPPPDLLD